MLKKGITKEGINARIDGLREKESQMRTEKEALGKLVEGYKGGSPGEAKEVQKAIDDSRNELRDLDQQMQKELEETYDDLNEVAKNGQPPFDYNNSGFSTYSKDWCCGDRSDSGKKENKIDKLEKFRDRVYGEITE